MTFPAERLFALLVRVYSRRTRARFGAAMRHAFECEWQAARASGIRAILRFWCITIVDTIRFAIADRAGGFTMRGALTVDWRDAWRALGAAPVVTVFAVVSLALGIGGATALFTILNSLVLKPLPVRDPDRLVLLGEGPASVKSPPNSSWTNPIWEAVRDRQALFAESAFAWATDRFNLSSTSANDLVEGLWVSGSLFDGLGVAPALGRTINLRDDVRGGGSDGPVAVISHRFWQRRLAGDPSIVGRTLMIERVPFTIVGVTPVRFFGPDVGRVFDVAIPLGTEPLVRPRNHALDGRSVWWINIMARLKPGVTAERATAQLLALQPEIREATMPTERSAEARQHYLADPFALVPAPQGRSPLRRQYEAPLTAVLWVVALVLLIACANIANLLIARATTRRHELTLRLALGASRSRVARQLVAEGVLLATGGALLGAVFAAWGSRALVAQLTTFAATVRLDLGLDWRVLGFISGVSAIATILFAVAPALGVTRLSPMEALKEHGRSHAFERRGGIRQATVIVQVALSLTLVVAAGLFVRTFVALATRDAGFTRDGLLLVGVDVYRNPVDGLERSALFERLGDTVKGAPGVATAVVSYTTPIARAGMNTMIAVPPDSTLPPRERMTWVNAISAGWLEAFGVRLAAGRDFDGRDRPGSPPVAIVNRTFERRFLGGRPAVGATFTTVGPSPGSGHPVYEVVAVVEDAVYRSLRAPMEPTVYLPLRQWDGAPPFATIAVRGANGASSGVATAVAAAIAKEDPTAVLSFRSFGEQIDAALTQERLVAALAAFFGMLGLVLSAVGLYGLTAYAVVSRRAEIGIRMALGASSDGLVRLMLRHVAWLVGWGIAIGACLSAWASTLVRSLLYGLEPRDPVTFAGSALLLVVVASIAAWLPARGAARIDPMSLLRDW
jgi:putative ABC transport system permease protein